VIFLHHAGGSSLGYLPFGRLLPPGWQVLGLDLPNRVTARDEQPAVTMEQAVAAALQCVLTDVVGPFAVFGHSMGATVSFELVRELERRGRPPVWLGVSASAAPGHGRRFYSADWSREQLVTFLRILGGTPESALAVPELVDRMVSTLAGDLSILDSYTVEPGPVLRTPMSVLRGQDDPTTTDAVWQPWCAHADRVIATHTLPGGHFYLLEDPATVSKRIETDIEAAG
jgi:surfactin synthase thioesterase subunit